MYTETLSRWDKIRYYFPNYKHHHIPQWMKKSIRAHMVKLGTWKPCVTFADQYVSSKREIFDHWGQVKTELGAILVSQPYFGNDAMAIEFAKDIDCNLVKLPVGIHAADTVMYIFSEKPTTKK